MTDKITARDVEAALAQRFAPPAFAFIPQMADGTGMNASRRADAVAMSLWPSRGLYLSGFEIKVDRSDWLHELRDPAKAEAATKFCRYWWLVTSPDVVSAHDPLPADWGRMLFNGKTIEIAKAAPDRATEPLTVTFIAALFRGVTTNYVPKSELIRLARDEAEKIAKKRDDVAIVQKRLQTVKSAIEKASSAIWSAERAMRGDDAP